MDQILVFGAGGHAKVIIDIIEKQGRYKIAGIVDRGGADLLGYKYLGGDDAVAGLGVKRGIVAVGDNFVREKIVAKIAAVVPDFEFVTAVHPSAQLARGVVLGAGSVVMAGACLNTDTRVGAHCIINTQSSLDHECAIADFASIAPGAILGGNVTVGAGSAVCLGAKIIHKVGVGTGSVVGAGAVVVEDVPAGVLAFGVPCRVIKKREPGSHYL
jgi:sugar O-acyltransferase (sialic acid O-acetyltransferase NeuD family)